MLHSPDVLGMLVDTQHLYISAMRSYSVYMLPIEAVCICRRAAWTFDGRSARFVNTPRCISVRASLLPSRTGVRRGSIAPRAIGTFSGETESTVVGSSICINFPRPRDA
ncbi:hypothetical protein H310_07933 [Aphanomyces invadans]|uniref:Uncharacterized protein n=1 Tax=Aphanomyces invadans TaxID=157072 RepID=A0A024U2V4_9STRA|nr:hypothetical protein H310_07933 [Aphanomyces invadans]ETV99902.1 hypothetical protein H310_07933 [Aphanomyces invadans]|eukprot:XP_008871678.1 hypothetical protein H310_07933 [Aphanomyces invadans]